MTSYRVLGVVDWENIVPEGMSTVSFKLPSGDAVIGYLHEFPDVEFEMLGLCVGTDQGFYRIIKLIQKENTMVLKKKHPVAPALFVYANDARPNSSINVDAEISDSRNKLAEYLFDEDREDMDDAVEIAEYKLVKVSKFKRATPAYIEVS